MEVLALFFLLTKVVFVLPRINGLPVDQPDHFPFYLLKTYSQNNTQLYLSSKNISNIPINTFKDFSALEILDLSHNSLTYNSLPCGSLIIPTLRHLNTASNQLTTVPSCLPAALKFLDLSKNIIRQIKLSEFTELYNLKMLLLSHNLISKIVPSGTVMAQLEFLDLSYNNFTKLRLEFQMPNLTMLRLEGNPLQQLDPYEFSRFPKLHDLNLSMTSLEVCNHKVFALGMENLKILDLSANVFKTFDPQWFEGLNNLQFLLMRQMPFLLSLPGDLFVHTPSLIHVDLGGSSQLHIVKSSMFESLVHLKFLSLESCNLTVFRPWNLSTNSTVTIGLSGNPLVCSCELTWLIIEAEKVRLNRTNDTRCHKNGLQREILLTDLIDKCSINGSHTQELQVSASVVQIQLLQHTTRFHNSLSNTKISSNKLPGKFDISTSSPNSTNLLNSSSSNSNFGTLQTEESTTQNDQSWTKSKLRVKTSTSSSTMTRDGTGIKHYPSTTNRYPTTTNRHPLTTRDQTEAKHHPPATNHYPLTTKHYPPTTNRYPPTTRDQTGIKHYPPTTNRYPPTTNRYPPTTNLNPPTTNLNPPTTRDQTEAKHYPPTTNHYPPTANRYPPTTNLYPPTTNRYPPTTRDQTEAKHYPPTTNHYPPIANRYPPTTNHYPPTTRDQTEAKHYPPTANHYPPTANHYPPTANHYPPTARDQTEVKHYPPTTNRYPPTANHYPPTANHYSPTTRDQTEAKHYPPTSNHYAPTTNRYPQTTKGQTKVKHYPPTTNRYPPTTNHYPPSTRDQTEAKHHPPTTNRYPDTTNHYPQNTKGQTKVKHYPTTTNRYPPTTNRYPTTTNRYPTTTNRYPTTTNRYPTTTNRYPTTTNRYPTTTNHYPTTTNRYPTTTNRYPTTTNRYPTTINRYPPTTKDQTAAKHHPTTATSMTLALPELPIIMKGPIFIMIEDDDDLESLKEEEITRPTHAGDCNYDPCRHWQVPCHDLQHLTGCRCPDIAGEEVPPDPVKIQKVIKISDNSAEIYWCAPSSTVFHYYIIYQSDDNRHLYKTDTINPTYRRYTLHDLASDSTYHTCVVAVNKAGSSTASSIWPSKGPCYIFKTKPNYNSIFYIASTAIIAILFILVVILTVCLCKIRLKGQLTDLSRISLDPLTLQNPAFENHLELADPRTIGTIMSTDSE
ncbi:uncharacterized protein [Scyliorhinus torazame]|uniref:uncharacterized protein n=1 Tax=Scyliorhinus torazame TaxID=75743 RepID=UPI003B58C554